MTVSAAIPDALAALGRTAPGRAARLAAVTAALHEAVSIGPSGAVLDSDGGWPAALVAYRRAADELDRWCASVGASFADAGIGDHPNATVFGDVRRAHHVAVVVPGMGTTSANEVRTLDVAARHVYDAAEVMAPGDVAVIAWLGYRAPGIGQVLLHGRAVVGGRALADYLDDLAVLPEAETTVVAHSFGSVVAAEALRDGMTVDNLVVVGSPGMEASSAGELPLHGARLYAERAPFDVVALSEAYGPDPTDPRFGATRLATGHGADAPTGHSSYFNEGTLALANIAAVIAGRPELLDVQEPTALEELIGPVDRAWQLTVEAPVDGAQGAVGRVDDVLTQFVDGVPAGPLEPAFDVLARGQAAAVEEGSRLVDVVQRFSSPDFAGDVAGDLWSVFGP
jgi:alpha-beta hydrolase superfamily lysophospholipase